MVAGFQDIPDDQVIKYIETSLQDHDKIKQIKKSVQKMKDERKREAKRFKKNLIKSLKKSINKSLKKSVHKSLKKTDNVQIINDFINRLKDKMKNVSISDSVRKKLNNELNKDTIRNFRKKTLRNKYSRENQKCEQRNIFNCQKGYNSCRVSLKKMGCVFDSQHQKELINAILDECPEDECDCTSKEKPYKNYYRGRKYCSDIPESLLKLYLLASFTRYPEFIPILGPLYRKKIGSFLEFNRDDFLYNMFISIALIPSIFTFLKASRQIMYEIDNQGFGKVFKKYCRTVETSLMYFPARLIISVLSTMVCNIITSSVLGPVSKEGDLVFRIMRKHNNFKSESTLFRDFIFSALGDKGVLSLAAGFGGSGEEIFFRETLPKLLQRIRPYLFKYYEKKFSSIFKENSQDKVEQKVKQTYTILLSSMSGLLFGLSHIVNLAIQDLPNTICQVVNTIVGGCFYSYLREKKGLATVWMIHFMNNYLGASLG